MRRKNILLAVGMVLLAASPLCLHAQSGCTDSPEDPTAVLALLGSAAVFGEYIRRRFLAGRASRRENQ